MQITALLKNNADAHELSVSTAGREQRLPVAGRVGGGSAVNGGELLMAALATCYCNDLYREAARLGIELTEVEVRAQAEFAGIGLAASLVRYSARIVSPAPQERIDQLLRETDAVAEVHNSLRAATEVTLQPWPAQG